MLGLVAQNTKNSKVIKICPGKKGKPIFPVLLLNSTLFVT